MKPLGGYVSNSVFQHSLAKEYGVEQEYITPYTPEQNGMIECFFRTIKEECIWQHCFKSRDEAFKVIAA